MVRAVTILVGGSLLAFAHGTLSERADRFGPGVGAALIAIVFWVAVVRPAWVKLTAEAYADQFVGAVDMLSALYTAHAPGVGGFVGGPAESNPVVSNGSSADSPTGTVIPEPISAPRAVPSPVQHPTTT